MNVKTLASYASSVVDRVLRNPHLRESVKAENSSRDRDPNGRRDPDKGPGKDTLTDEEIEKAMEALKSFSGVKDNHLVVELVAKGKVRFVIISEPNGTIVRRIPESELWPLLLESEKVTGQLIDKTG